MIFEPVAIVGRACVLPGALTPEALHEAVRAGRDLVSAAPADRWRLRRSRILGTPAAAADRTWSDRGGYVRGFESVFDPEGFGVPAAEVLSLDPLFRWLLHVSRGALRDAGAEGGPRTGAVFGNLSFPSAGLSRFAERVWVGERLADCADIAPADARNRFSSGLPAHLVARALGLGGGAFCLDAACASSLYAIKLACDRLHDRSADVMLAGAVNCADDLFIHVGFCALQAMSRTGQSRPFHRAADGLVPAEGAGAVVLKRLDDAERAGDRILGVIRGIGLSNDGRGSGLLVPSEDGQVRAMEAAYAVAGLSPRSISLVECHATGTTVGDAAELRSMRRVFADARDVPIGSLKSNFGHAITAAGVAGLIKLLGALGERIRPPTLHVDEPLDELASSPFRLVREAEPWVANEPRRAALSAFGFGGNNAHLIVEEYCGPAPRIAAVPGPWDEAEVAIVAMGAAVGSGTTLSDFEAALFSPPPEQVPSARSIAIPARDSRFPPRDLERALAQQTWVLAAAREALAGLKLPERERSGAFIGMGCDPEVARYGARWRVADWAELWGVESEAWQRQAGESFTAVLEPAGVLGTMPNIPANRLNVQFDLGGQGFTVAAEELSGLRALQVGVRALLARELDLALVGAADFSREPVHEAALRELGVGDSSGDGAIVLALKRADDARRDGDPILALLASEPREGADRFDVTEVEQRFGKPHAAFGLLSVASAALCCARGRKLAGEPWTGERSAQVEVEALGGQRASVVVRSDGAQPLAPARLATDSPGPVREYPAHPPRVVVPAIPDEQGESTAGLHLRPWAPPTGTQRMEPAPELPRCEPEFVEPDSPPAHRPAPGEPLERVAVAGHPALATPRVDVAQALAAQHALLGRVHRQFLENQAAVHQSFLAMRERTANALLHASTRLGAAATPAATGTVSATRAAQPIAPASGGAAPEAGFPGPKLDRRGLEVHASGRISEIFGSQFARQDGFHRQVRMPEPPLLLADRLLGIDAEPGSMGLGTLWTETDVTAGAWYLHDGHMPAGIMIESGQADLMLISYLGVDFLNQGERVYRLLGCDLTYHGPLPSPGDTLRYDIHVDGHANQGDIRLFFFHYDCRIRGQPRLTVRNGQAGFFTDGELADSKGVLWDAESAEREGDPRLDAPAVVCERSRFDRPQLEAFASGRVRDCFGKGFEFASTHTRTPRISGGKMLLLEEVTDFSPRGGPWGRGYLRAVDRISPDDWFFAGHFKNDPCMPGTLMFEGCLQAMAFYLAGLGYTLDKDGWLFQPVPEATYKLRCRGQATPRSREVVYEVFVEEVVDGPIPTLWADLLCTVDGLKAFHCRRMGLQLVPGWPLDARPELGSVPDDRPIASADGFRFDHRSLLACAWGRPSEAFGPMYRPFDSPRRVPRLPGPPYHFMSRIARTEGDIGAMKVGTTVEAEYDVPKDAWYFDENGAPTMPFCVLLEAALQPCGWLASYVGSALTTEHDVSFRNLDGTGRVLGELLPGSGTLRTRATITNISQSAGMIIESFDVLCTVGDRPVYELKTVFGFFPKEALAAQKGLPIPDEERRLMAAPSEQCVDLRERPAKWFISGPRLATARLSVIDRVSGIWPTGGKAGLGQYRAEMDVDTEAWFFKAHFFQDPVQPGSLGLEALIQLLQFAMIHSGMAEGAWARGRFEPIATGLPLTWKYRGQVLPKNERVTTLIELVGTGEDERGRFAIADGSLWVDGMRIYEAKGLGMRIVPDDLGPRRPSGPEGGGGDGEVPSAAVAAAGEEVLDPAKDGWLADHCPTWTFPALPLMSMVDRLAAAAAGHAPGKRVVAVENARAHRWLPLRGPVRLKTEVAGGDGDAFDVTLLAWREASTAALSRFEPVATGRVVFADGFPRPGEEAWTPPADARPVPDPYAAGTLFHGPAFQLLKSLAVGASGSTAILGGETPAPAGALHQVLLDALTHGIPHDGLSAWTREVGDEWVAYPHRVASLRLYAPLPRRGQIRCETRFAGFDDGEARFPMFEVQAIADGEVIAALKLVEVLLPKGPLGSVPPAQRRAFLRDRQPVSGMRLSQVEGGATRLSDADVSASDWLPGTIAHVYAATGSDAALEVAAKEHVAARAGVHPATVHVAGDGEARCDAEPLTVHPIRAMRYGDCVGVSDGGPPRLDLAPVREFWDRYFQLGRWPVEDLFYGLAERFVRRVRVADPVAFARARGRGVLYLGNHQVAVESLMFSILASGLTGVPTVTLAKAEHRTTWLGQLIKHAFTYPGARDPGVITFFDRSARDQLPQVVAELAEAMRHSGKSVMVHVEGTRALSCRTPVEKMSGAFLDMAIATGAPVVPVRFVGGLPVDPLDARIEFPLAMGKQEIHLGAPIEPGELAALNYKARKERVVAAINALGPANADEAPSPGDPEFAAEAGSWVRATGASPEHAVLLETLRRVEAPCAETRALLDGAARGAFSAGPGPKGLWMAELARRLFGERGPKVVAG